MIDFDRASHLRALRMLALAGGMVCIVALVTNLLDVTWPADVLLGLAVVVFFVHVINYTTDLHDMKLVDDSQLRPRESREEYVASLAKFGENE